jgi:CheY-like chemotaxis protein
VVDSAISMVWNQLKTRAKLVRAYSEGVDVAGDETRLGQVFLNLLVNAAQSIRDVAPDSNVIKVTIRREDSFAVVEIGDTGIGMSKALRARIFEPFFTTKGQGEGTGLGLSICRDIVEAHVGEIFAESEPGLGSTFTVRLPLWGSGETLRPSDRPTIISSHRRLCHTPAVRTRVWIVDDDPLVAHAMSRMLGDTYQVLVTLGPQNVLDRIQQGETFDTLLCDVSMPEMNGMDLARHIAEMRPDLERRVVFISGGAFSQSTTVDPKRLYLQKPFGEIDLRRIIERATDT